MSTCPRCHVALGSSEYEGTAVESCAGCGGQWIGQPQLKEIIDTHERTRDLKQLRALEHTSVRGIVLAQARESLSCPRCAKEMETFQYGADSGILLDRCKDCRGIWLDQGEIEKVQMVAEASDMDLEADAKRLSGDLRQVELHEDKLEQGDRRGLQAPLLAAVVDRVLDAGGADTTFPE